MTLKFPNSGMLGNSKTLQSKTTLILSFFLCFMFCGAVSAAEEPISPKTLFEKYQKAVILSEGLQLYRQDPLLVRPRLKRTAEMIEKNQHSQAASELDALLRDLNLQAESSASYQMNQRKNDWLKLSGHLFQKVALLVILGLIFIRLPSIQDRLAASAQTSLAESAAIALWFSLAGTLFSMMDLLDYGQSAWFFVDVHYVLTAAAGLTGGLTAGLMAGIISSLIRLQWTGEWLPFPVLLISAGVLGAAFKKRIKNFDQPQRVSLLLGLILGLIQAHFTWRPAASWTNAGSAWTASLLLGVCTAGALWVFMMSMATVLKDRKRQESENELLKAKILFLQAQIRPHFLLNALNTIASLCGEQRAAEAEQVVVKLSRFLTLLLRREEEMTTVKEELTYLDYYLDLEKIRFETRLQIEKEILLNEQQLQERLPVLILQPLVENAVKHGIAPLERGGVLRLKAYSQDQVLVFEIINNGQGQSLEAGQPVKVTERRGTGIGLKNIRERLARLYGSKASLEMESEPGGTRVKVTIPLKRQS